jgi:hypothetical protein
VSDILNCITFSMAPSAINENPKKCDVTFLQLFPNKF